MTDSISDAQAYQKAYRLANKEKLAAQHRAYYLANKEIIKARAKEWANNNKDKVAHNKKAWAKNNRHSLNQAQLRYKAKNYELVKERARVAARKYYSENSELLIARSLAYAKANPEKNREKQSIRRSRMAKSKKYLVTKQELRKLYSLPCYYCGSKDKIQLDHVMPLSKGGNHSIGNLVPACQGCNLTKQASLLIIWRIRHNMMTLQKSA